MQTRSLVRLSAVLSLAIVAAASRSAEAHFILNAPQNWWTQTTGTAGGAPQKNPPCGNEAVAGSSATGTVNVYQPGQPVSVTVTSTVDHPGWWRISLREGRASTQTASAFPDPTPLGAANTALQCTPAFIDNPVWSPTQPVLADKLGLAPGSTQTDFFQRGTQTFSVTIPATARCTNASPCTLQVLMIMTDHAAMSCNYHHCADIAAAGGAVDAGGGTDSGTDVRIGTGGAPGTAGASGGGTGGRGVGGSNGTAGTAGGIGGASGGVGGAVGAAGQSGGNGLGGRGVGGSGDAGTIDVVTPPDSGCGSCAVGTRTSAAGWTAAGLLIAGLLLRRRRRSS